MVLRRSNDLWMSFRRWCATNFPSAVEFHKAVSKKTFAESPSFRLRLQRCLFTGHQKPHNSSSQVTTDNKSARSEIHEAADWKTLRTVVDTFARTERLCSWAWREVQTVDIRGLETLCARRVGKARLLTIAFPFQCSIFELTHDSVSHFRFNDQSTS